MANPTYLPASGNGIRISAYTFRIYAHISKLDYHIYARSFFSLIYRAISFVNNSLVLECIL